MNKKQKTKLTKLMNTPTPNLPLELPDRIRRARRHTGLTQHQLGLLLAVRRESVSRWEAGTLAPSPRNALWLELLNRVATRRLGTELRAELDRENIVGAWWLFLRAAERECECEYTDYITKPVLF